MAVLTLLIISHAPLLFRYITCITFDLLMLSQVLTSATFRPSYLTQVPSLKYGRTVWPKIFMVVLGSINILLSVYGITNSKRYSVFHGILI